MRAAVSIRRPASADRGMNRAYGANTIMMSATATADTTPDHCVCPPACWLIADRVSEPDPGMHWKKLPVRLATPSLRHCWFRSSFWRVTAAMAFAIEIASRSPSSAMASALVENARIWTASSDGSRKPGSVAGMSPTTVTPCRSSPSQAVAPAAAMTAIRNSGRSAHPSRRLSHRSARTNAIEARPRANVGPCAAPPSVIVSQKRTRKWSCAVPTAFSPSRFFIWSSTSSRLAPAVKPTMTECEMYRVRSPRRARLIAS
jgi:hypothetical protein